MTVAFKASFNHDLEAITDSRLLRRVESVIKALEEADSLAGFPQLKRLKGYSASYRVRIGDFRMGLYVTGECVNCVSFLHRREIYRYFP